MKPLLKITTIGAGYVGLVTGVCFSDFGYDVTCVDKDAEKINRLNAGEIPIFEKGLEALVKRNKRANRLHFTADLAVAMQDTDVVFIGVGTPPAEDGSADLQYVMAAARELAPLLSGFTVIAIKSTVPVGTGGQVEALIKGIAPKADFAVVSNPEFLREGVAISDFKDPDRVIIGTVDDRARDVMARLYRPFSALGPPIVFTDRRTSELLKYAANAFLATKISFINEIADLCEAVGANITDLAFGMGLDERIGSKYLAPGPGYGGSCFPKDTVALLDIAKKAGAQARIVEQVIEVNDTRKASMAQKVTDLCGGSVDGLTVAILGLAFKPDTDDIRETASFPIIQVLQKAGANIRAFDPAAMEESAAYLEDVTFCEDAYDCASGADVLILATEWTDFQALDFSRLKTLMAAYRFADLRNVYTPEDVRKLGFDYVSIGRP
jgi:UDPglucose 6-dehydrogenase